MHSNDNTIEGIKIKANFIRCNVFLRYRQGSTIKITLDVYGHLFDDVNFTKGNRLKCLRTPSTSLRMFKWGNNVTTWYMHEKGSVISDPASLLSCFKVKIILRKTVAKYACEDAALVKSKELSRRPDWKHDLCAARLIGTGLFLIMFQLRNVMACLVLLFVEFFPLPLGQFSIGFHFFF